MAEKSSIPSLILSQKFYTASVNMIEHDFKIWNVSIVRIVNYQLSFGIICSKQFYLRSRSSIGWLKSFIQITYIAVIKGQYYIKRRKSSSWTCLARWLFTIPCFFNTCNPRLSERSPSWRSRIPALSISHWFLSSRSCTRCLKIASADGERQIFPRQTNRILRFLLESAILDWKPPLSYMRLRV